ncbi:MAG: oligosaccharide flippase family protein [Pseudomonadota bacterium]
MSAAVGLILARSWMNVCGLLAFLLVARVVLPEDIGIYALASSAVLLPMSLVGAGFAEHVVGRDPTGRDLSTAYWSSLASGAIGVLIALGSAAIAYWGFGQPEIAQIMLLMAPLPFIWSAGVIPEAVLIRDGRGAPLAIAAFASDLLGLIALAAGVMLGWGVMSLVANRFVSCIVMVLGVSIAAPPRGLSGFEWSSARRVGGFGAGLLGSRLAGWAGQFGTEFVIGVLLSTAAVGYYRLASRLVGAMYSVIMQGPSSAQLAYFGRGQQGPPKAYDHALRLHVSLAAPVIIAVTMGAPLIIQVALGPNWQPSAFVLSMLALAVLPQIGAGIASTMLIAHGHARRAFVLHSAMALATVLGLLAGSWFGLDEAAIARLAMAVAVLVPTVAAVPELRPSGVGRTLRIFAAVALPSAGMALAMNAVLVLWPAGPGWLSGLMTLAVAGALGFAVYVLVSRLILRRTTLLFRLLLADRLPGKLGIIRRPRFGAML